MSSRMGIRRIRETSRLSIDCGGWVNGSWTVRSRCRRWRRIGNYCNRHRLRQWHSSRGWVDSRSTRLCASSRKRVLSSLRWNKGFAKRLCIHHSASLCPRARYSEYGTSYSAFGRQDGNTHWCTRNGGCQHLSRGCGAR